MSSLPTACVIGAGSSGIAAAKALHERGITFDCFETVRPRRRQLGLRQQERRCPRAYRSLHINTSRERMEYSDFPMPKSYPGLPAPHAHRGVLRRLRRPLRLPRPHPLRDRRRARRAPRRRRLGARARQRRDASATTRCSSPTATTGTRAGPSPRSPAPTRSRACRSTRTTTRRRRRLRRGKNVVVLGMGNRAMDIAVEASYVAEQHLPRRPPRRAHHPQVRLRQADRPDRRRRRRDPVRGPRARSRGRSLKVTLGDMERLRPAQARPPLRRGAPDGLRRHPRPHRARRRSRPSRTSPRSSARRACASPTAREVEADVVVYCTGYKVTFPFFDEGFISAPDNDLPLFRRVFHPDIDERLLRRAAAAARRDHAARRGAVEVGRRLPRAASYAPARRRARCEPTSTRERRAMRKRYVASKRHTIQVDFDDYLVALGQGAQGGRRARAARRPPRCRCRRAPRAVAA